MGKVVIIGCGYVGITYAYSLISTKMNCDEIVLIDINKEKLIGDYLDLSHSLYYSENKIKLKIGEYKDIEGADIICITAGASQTRNKSRLDDFDDAKKIFKDITQNIKKYKFNGIFLIASNPNDVMCYAVHKYLDYDPYKIIGSGISLDTSRLINIIEKEINFNINSIKGYVLGEHGESAFVVWNSTYINDKISYQIFNKDKLNEILDEVHNVSKKIVASKNATYYGVSTCLCKITKCVLNDLNYEMPLSCYDKSNDVFIGNVAKVGKNGISDVIKLNMTKDEEDLYMKSVNIVKEYNKKL